MVARSAPRIALIGAGFSALSLLDQWRERGTTLSGVIVYADPREALTGPAYADWAGQSLLNTRAADLGLSPAQPGAFADWLGLAGPDRDGFRARTDYGAYLRAQWADLLRAPPFPIDLVGQRAHAVLRDGQGFIVDAGDLRERFDAVVLATGPLPAAPLPMLGADVQAHPGYVDDPWRNDWSDGLAADASVVVLGTGLSMLDHVLHLRGRGHRAPIIAISRHGLLPRPHPEQRLPAEPLSVEARAAGSTRALLRALREACATRMDWQAAFDAIRPHIAELWRGLPAPEQARFLRHARSYWEVHRHRCAPELWREQQRWIAAGELRIVAARVNRVRVAGDGLALDLRRRGHDRIETLHAERLLRATGIDGPLQHGVDPLIDTLIAQDLVHAHPLGLGLEVDEGQHVLDARGEAVPGLYALGALARGLLWESTAIPELRQRAAVVAAAIQ
jgi:uncharacterized NAD(P)/FAD-binding protein YdhS